MVKNSTFLIQSESRPTFHDVTDRVAEQISEAGIKNGVVLVFSQHTTCSVMIQEQSDDVDYYGTQYVLQDLVNVLNKIVPTCTSQGQYLHPGPLHIEIAGRERDEEAFWSLNTDAHLRSVIMGRSETIPLVDGNLVLGEFGRIYFADFDQVRARERTVHVQIVGE
jgi:secondary thiamine-phosphate synthase enzyme